MKKRLLLIKALIAAHGEKDYVRFVITGVFNTALCSVIYSCGIQLGLPYYTAIFIGWAITVVVAFVLQSRFVFRKSGNMYKRFPIFVLSNMVSLIVSMLMLSLLIKMFHIHAILAQLITIPVVVVMNFVAGKFIVFN